MDSEAIRHMHYTEKLGEHSELFTTECTTALWQAYGRFQCQV